MQQRDLYHGYCQGARCREGIHWKQRRNTLTSRVTWRTLLLIAIAVVQYGTHPVAVAKE
jgi:hypothetical protein